MLASLFADPSAPFLFDLCATLWGTAVVAASFCAYLLNTEG